jgi:molybdopterin-guanine dinucleotide biosynthesis protein A
MGTDKASLDWGGLPLGVAVADRLAGWFDEVIVSADHPGPFAGGPYRVVPDPVPGVGALGGLHGALSGAGNEWLFLTACDMPYLQEALIRRLWEMRSGWDAVVPVQEKGKEPLCAFYSRACLAPAAQAIAAGERQIGSFLTGIRLRAVLPSEWMEADPEGRSFRNLNTMEAYRAAVEAMALERGERAGGE